MKRTRQRPLIRTQGVPEMKDHSHLPPCARHDLLRVLTSDSRVRADVVRQFHERGAEGMVEVLAELEGDDLLRLRVVDELRHAIE